ncbi:MAG: carbohydrate ABC transporter permease [Treponema sp.]|jgi:multiple sugar transport system permease protein|nr:carbohydrate ABC transporter permease [Treponema sp.]
MNKITSYQLKRKTGDIIYKICRAALLFGLCFLILQPILDKLSVSFMEEADLYDPTVVVIPHHLSLGNYKIASNLMKFWATLIQSVIIFVASAVLQVTACTLSAYGMARYKFPGRNILFFCVFLIIIVPPQVILSPIYLNFQFFDIFGIIKLLTGKAVNLLGTLTGYFLLSATAMGLKSGLYIFLLRQYFRGVPKELEEAAYVDGCGRLYTFVRIILPDALPMLTSCFLFSFVWQWTDTIYGSIFLRGYKVMSLALSRLTAEFYYYWANVVNAVSTGTGMYTQPPIGYLQAVVATGAFMSIIPLILLYIVAQKTFVESLTQTGIKM